MQRDEVAEAMAETIRCLVDEPQSVEVRILEATLVTVLEVLTTAPDYGKVVGRKGRTADALREVLVGLSGAQKRQYTLSIVPPEGQPVRFQERPRRDSSPFEKDPVGATRSLLVALIRLLVDDGDAVSVEALEGQRAVIYEVGVAQPDMNRVIGIKGARADALRVLLANLGARAGRRFMLTLLEP